MGSGCLTQSARGSGGKKIEVFVDFSKFKLSVVVCLVKNSYEKLDELMRDSTLLYR